MSNTTKLAPTAITLKKQSKVLEIQFSDGFSFQYPVEYLRVFSPSAEVKTAEKPEHSKRGVNIDDIQMQGTYALLLIFDDGHDTGIYAWGTLHELGKNYDKNWADYLVRLAQYDLSRGDEASDDLITEVKSLKVVYFMELAKLVGMDEETVTLPASVITVEDLIQWQAERDEAWQKDFTTENVRVMLNKQFTELDAVLTAGDEVAFVKADKD